MKSTFIVRPLKSSDSDSWIAMWHNYLDFYQEKLTDQVTANTLSKLLSDDKTIGCLVICDEQNNSVGFLTYVIHFSTWNMNPVCYLHDLFVDEKYRAMGAASLLLSKLKEICNTMNCESIYWLTKPSNHVARMFYDKIARGEEWIIYSIR
jgi:ribosomal protein S18 acetylase RimI-like enzyme